MFNQVLKVDTSQCVGCTSTHISYFFKTCKLIHMEIRVEGKTVLFEIKNINFNSKINNSEN